MGVSRIRPSRILSETSLTVGNLPDGSSSDERATFEITGLPTRGIIRSARLIITDGAQMRNTGLDAIVLHTSGTAAAGTTADLSSADIQSTLVAITFKQEVGGGGTALGVRPIPTGIYMLCINMLTQYVFPASPGGPAIEYGPLFYDVSAGVLGPDANDGKLYVSFVSGEFDYTSVTSAKIVLEIEPAY
jgi:hypothetical protein